MGNNIGWDIGIRLILPSKISFAKGKSHLGEMSMVQFAGRDGGGPFENGAIPGVPGGATELEELFKRYGVTDKGRTFVLEALFGDPARRVGGGSNNVANRYPSRKMGRVIQGESRTVEYAFVKMCEYNPAVRFFLCQPGKLFVRRPDVKGRVRGKWTIPDYLVLDDHGFALVECKTEAELELKSSGGSLRFVRDGDRWRDPSAEEAVREYGFQFRVFSSAEVNGIWLRNMDYLANYDGAPDPDSRLTEKLLTELLEAGPMRVREALELVDEKTPVLWWLIANQKVWADLERDRIWEADISRVYSSRAWMIAGRELGGPLPDAAACNQASTVELKPGSRLLWNRSPYTVLNRGDQDVTLRPDEEGGRSVVVSIADFHDFLRSGAIQGETSEIADAVLRRLDDLMRCTSEKDRAEAYRRYRLLQEYEETGMVPQGCSVRTMRRYTKWAEEGLRLYGSRICGLIRFRGRRQGKSDMGDKQREVLQEVVELFAKDLKAGRVAGAYARLEDICSERGIVPAPSKGSLRLLAKRLSDSDLARDREGVRAAHGKSLPLKRTSNGMTAAADRAFQIAHVDHTQSDIELIAQHNGAHLGRAWFTVMEDDRSRMPLAALLSFERPNRVILAKLFADCVRRHHRLPDVLVVDQGAEFNSNYLEFTCAVFEITKRERPASKPRFGSIVESFFGTNNTRFLHELLGNTKLTRGRQQSSTHDPKRLAVWTLVGLHEILMKWLFEVYPALFHQTLGTTPRQAFEHDLAFSGNRASRYIPFDHNLGIILVAVQRNAQA